jgi:hypothetical protein
MDGLAYFVLFLIQTAIGAAAAWAGILLVSLLAAWLLGEL